MKKFLSALLACLLLASAMATVIPFIALAADGDQTALPHPFVKEGLVAYYEGTQNNRDGHNPDATTWQDLVGDNHMTVTVNQTNYFTEDGFHVDSTKHAFPNALSEIVNGEEFTVELQIKDLVSIGTNFNTLMNSDNDHFALFRRNAVDELEFKHTPDVPRPKASNCLDTLQDALITITRSVEDSCCRLYVNGQLKQEVIAPITLETTNLFFGHSEAGKSFSATYSAIRFYDRALSEGEVRHNAAAEGYLTIQDLYVQEGLVALFSGVSNTRDGYSADSTVWADLVGDNDLTLDTEKGTTYFTPEGLYTTGVRHYLSDAVLDTVNGETFTVEIAFGDFESIGESFNTFLNSSNDAFSLYRDSINDLLHFKFATNLIAERPRVEGAFDKLDNGLVTATYEVGGKCRLYVNGRLAAEVDSPSEMGADDLFIGHDEGHKLFASTYKSIRFYDRVLTAEEIAANADADGCLSLSDALATPTYITVAQPKTNIAGDVAMIRDIDSSDDLRAMMTLENRPAAAIYTVNAELEVLDSKGKAFSTLSEVLETTEYAILPVLRIKNAAAGVAIRTFADEHRFYDLCIISDNADVIKAAREAAPFLRAALDLTSALSDKTYLTQEDCVSIRRQVKIADAWLAILPAHLADRDKVQYLYDMQIPVWVNIPDKLTRTSAYNALLSGATGVISDGTGLLLDIACNEIQPNTMTRLPLNTGHRGLPSQAPENTIESATAAYNSGANCIEIDVYLTTDGEIVVMHDASTLRTTGVDLNVESCTWAQLSQLTADKGYENSKYAGARIPRFDDYLNFIKDKDCRLFIEIKSTNPAIIPALKDKIEASGAYAQCTMISFHASQLASLRTVYPDMVGGLLCAGILDETKSDKDMKDVMNTIGPISSTLNPQYPGYGENAARAANLRGISILPWTFNASTVPYIDPYLWGYASLTGDNADHLNRYLKDVTLTGLCDCDVHQIGSSLTLGLDVTTYGRTTKASTSATLLIVEGEELATVSGTTLTFTGNGKVTCVLRHTQKNGEATVVMYSQPITLTAGDGEIALPDESESLPESSDTNTEAQPGETSEPADTTQEPATSAGCKSSLAASLLCLPITLFASGFVIRKKR